MGMALEQAVAEIGQAQARIKIASPSRVDERDVDRREADVRPYGHAIPQTSSDTNAGTRPRAAPESQPYSKLEAPTHQLDQSHSQKSTVDLYDLEPDEPAVEQATNNQAPTAQPSRSHGREDVSLRFLLLLLLSGLVAVILGIALTFLLLGR
jgi:hypothetical protein